MATSGSGTLNAWNGAYTITLSFSWTRDANGVVSWSVNIPTIDGTSSPCWTSFYIRGGAGASASGDLTENLVSYCASCSQCATYYQGNILWAQTQSGTINMGQSGGTLRLGFFGVRNSSNTSEDYLTWGVDPISWTATLNYNANGGSGAPSTQSQSGLSLDTPSYDFTVSDTVPTRTDYTFIGWKVNDTTYFGGDTITIQKASPTVTLVAQWEASYRPGQRKVSGTWSSLNRNNGNCQRKVSGTWTEMRTLNGGVGTDRPPSRKTSGTWYNQRKIGAE